MGVLQLNIAPRWSQAPRASPEAICLTKILFTVSQRSCQPPISISLPAVLCGNSFSAPEMHHDAACSAPISLCILSLLVCLAFVSICLTPISSFHHSLFALSLYLYLYASTRLSPRPTRWMLSSPVHPYQGNVVTQVASNYMGVTITRNPMWVNLACRSEWKLHTSCFVG